MSGAVVAMHSANRWLQCTNCGDGSVIVHGTLYPGAKFGPEVEGLPEVIAAAYDEARNCMSVNAFTAAELVCRKILMNVAVDKGADEGMSFVEYLAHLEKQGYVTPPMKPWVDLIRRHGNQSTHEIPAPNRDRAEGTVMFTAELLRLIYEMDAMATRYSRSGGDA